MSKPRHLLTAAVYAFALSQTALADDANTVPDQGVSERSSSARMDRISRAAAVYGTYQNDVSGLREKPLSSASDIDSALTNLGGQNAGQLSTGWLAYSAMVAAQSPEFRAAVRDIEGFYGRDRVMTGMRNDVSYARTLDGGQGAISSALAATQADSRRLSSAAAYVKEQAYTLQGTGWAKARIGNANRIAASIETTSKSGRAPDAAVVSAFQSPSIDNALSQAGGSGAPSLWDGTMDTAAGIRFPSLRNPSLTARRHDVKLGREQVADRIATLAAYRVIGVDNQTAGHISSAMADTETSSCIRRSQLNLQQCVAASYRQYELPYCISQHALQDVGDCISRVSN
ncbi:MAG: hypothetical protein AAF292_06850 [Pseudomonadota bacterium]